MGFSVGINNKSRKAVGLFVGDNNGVARAVKKAYIGDANGVARCFYEKVPLVPTDSMTHMSVDKDQQ